MVWKLQRKTRQYNGIKASACWKIPKFCQWGNFWKLKISFIVVLNNLTDKNSPTPTEVNHGLLPFEVFSFLQFEKSNVDCFVISTKIRTSTEDLFLASHVLPQCQILKLNCNFLATQPKMFVCTQRNYRQFHEGNIRYKQFGLNRLGSEKHLLHLKIVLHLGSIHIWRQIFR